MDLSPTTIKIEFNSICRICLIQSEDTKDMNLTMFECCTGLDTSEISNLNRDFVQICEKCDNSLNDFVIFKKKCIETHQSLMTMCTDKKFDVNPFDHLSLDLIEPSDPLIDIDKNKTECSADEMDTFIYSDLSEPDIDGDDDLFGSTIKKKRKPKSTTKSKIEKSEEIIRVICEHCGKSYSRTTITNHITLVHKKPVGEQERLKCDQCDRTFKNRGTLDNHKRIHRDVFYRCKFCDKDFKNWGTRQNHIVFAHGAPYNYNCTVCSFKTNGSSAFKNHSRTHTGEMPYECNECSRKFMNSRNLKVHMTTHSNEKNFSCEYCNKAFPAMRNLRAHIKIHTQERNYVCPVESCGKSFIQNHVLKSHMKANHPEVAIPPPGSIVSIKPKRICRKV